MAQKRKKPPQKPAPFSPSRYLREKARSFPILNCFCSDNWQDQGLVQAVIIRKQPSGKLLVGFFLVDVYCLGIKAANCRINQEPEEVASLINQLEKNQEVPMVECTYVFLHNLIYGALEYAKELGFFPDPDFNLVRYILEADTDEIELIELEFGKNGKPFFFAGPYDNVNRILATLERKLGAGNYDYVVNIDA